MSRPRILQNGPQLPALEKQLGDHFDVHALHQEKDRDAFLAANGASFVGIVTSARYGANAALIDALPNLRVISSFGVGLDTIAVDRAKARGIQIGYTPDVLNDCVADTAFALLIDAARRFSESDRYLRAGKWAKAPFPVSTKVSGKRLGILGLGRIGKVVAKRASGFDMEVRYHNRRKDPTVSYTYMETLKGLAEWADFLVVVSAGGPETRHLVSAEILAALGPKGFVINVARGSVIDQDALIKAAGWHDRRSRPGRLRQRTEHLGGSVRPGQRGAAAAPGQRNARDTRRDGRADIRQSGGVLPHRPRESRSLTRGDYLCFLHRATPFPPA